MAKKVLGQSNPSATTATTLYTVPSAKEAVVSSISVCNLASSSATYRIAIRPAGATLANVHYLAYDVTVGAADTTIITVGVTLATTDVITVYASTANLVFHAYGDEAEELLKILKLMYTNHALTKALADRLAGEPLIEFPKEPEPEEPLDSGWKDLSPPNANTATALLA